MNGFNLKFGVKLTVLTLAALGMNASFLSVSSVAQYSDSVDPLQDFNRREMDDQGGEGFNQNTILDLIHQSQRGNFGIDYEAVQMRQQQSIQDAATEFRERQRQLLEQQNSQGDNYSTPSPQE